MADIIDFKPREPATEYTGTSEVVPFYPDSNQDWSDVFGCWVSELKPLSDEDHHMMEVHDVCQVLETRIEDETGNTSDIEFIMEELVDLGEQQHPYYMIAKAYVALIDEDYLSVGEVSDRETYMDYIEPIAGKSHTGRLAHFVLLLNAQEYREEKKVCVRNALSDHGEDDLIRYKCKELARGNEFLEKLVEKYS
ncbi:hypothetical protein GOV10_05260 [Candidatus Woesearchaeota archaeon]|nr:hypothetical protein [Candidatus Woesearchaeota archaeon]